MQVKHLDSNHRLYILLVAVAVFIAMLNGGMAILTEEASWSHKVAGSTKFGTDFLGAAFVLSALMVAPLVASMARNTCRRSVFKIAAYGAAFGSVLSIGMAYMSRHMDLGWFSVYYFATGVFCLLVAGVLGAVLNTALARQSAPC